MYLKKLEMQGFKSFVDRIELNFEKGITAIVGPNGSGKSNISDAIRWVMGEQSIKSLRGSKMEDVIFAGTQKRKPLGYAEVCIVLDNSDRSLPVDYSEVSVMRRLFRSGESEYYINKCPCRLKDIHELFMDTGLGRDGYSIIGQGRIDEILSAKAEDRREIFEEASGISKYKYRRAEAQRRLEQTEENLVRIRDIIAELENQLEPLHAQSEKAKEYLRLRDTLKTLEVSVFVKNIDKHRTSLEELEKNYAIAKADLEAAENELKALEEETERLYRSRKEHDEEIERARAEHTGLENLKIQYESEISILKNNMENSKSNIKRIESEIAQLEEKMEGIDSELAVLSAQIGALEERSRKTDDEIRALEERSEEAAQESRKKSELLDELRREITEQNNALLASENRAQSIEVLKESFSLRLKELDDGIAKEEKEIESLTLSLKEITAKRDGKKSECGQIRAQIVKTEEEKTGAEKQLGFMKEEYNRLASELGQKMSRKKLLQDMERDYEGYLGSVKAVLTAWEKGELKCGVVGAMSKLIKVPADYVTALEAALGSAMQNIVVKTEEDGKAAIEFLKQRRGGRATFLPISAIKPRMLSDDPSACDGYIGIASELIEYDGNISGVVRNLLGSTVVVDNIDNGIKMAKRYGHRFKIVTLAGDILNAGGSMTGGSASRLGLLTRAKELEALSEECKRAEKELDKFDRKIEKQAELAQGLSNKIEELKILLSKEESKLVGLESDISLTLKLLESAREELEELSDKRKELLSHIGDADDERSSLKKETERAKARLEELQQRLEAEQESFRQIMHERDEISSLVLNKRVEHNSIIKDIEALTEKKKTLSEEKQRLDKQLEYRKFEHDEQIRACENYGSKIEEIRQLIAKAEENIKRASEKMTAIAQSKDEADMQILKLREKSKAASERLLRLKEDCARMESKKGALEAEVENAINRLWDEYELTYTAALEIRKEVDSRRAQHEINELRSKIRALGNINIDAIEEYKSVKERYDFLTAQRDDLEKTKADIEKIIRDMTRVMKLQFAENFKIINKYFGEVFAELFGGGRAELKMTDENDILEGGIEIEVQPPGKKLQNLMLLSGGERALAAIALLFAILRAHPTPFCVLDEIEAALDDVNVYRFAEYIKSYSDKTQFIIVTHRRGTMEAADVLYGVTMQEKGVSKLLSIKLDDMLKGVS